MSPKEAHMPGSETPDPELLLKSLAEQGYSLETSLADLIDNAVSAGADKVEILVDTAEEPFMLFIGDNGSGMDKAALARNMRFPSASPESLRSSADLGRFGLGMKTASFSQTRTLTVLSRRKGTKQYYGKTWDIGWLQKNRIWKSLDVSPSEMKNLLAGYQNLSSGFLNAFDDFLPSTIIVWQGLYKFETYLETDRQATLQNEITGITSEYLSLVFHRYMEKKDHPLHLRVNNHILQPFNPFPVDQNDFRRLETSQRNFRTDKLTVQGYVLPARSLEESKKGLSVWTQAGKSLADMEGIYVYRSDRIIIYGKWLGTVKRSPRLRLARLKVDIGNSVDQYFHLNVAKSSIVIPYELRDAFGHYVDELRIQAEKEYFNRGVRTLSGTKKRPGSALFIRLPSSNGMLMHINEEFPLIKILMSELSEEQIRLFRFITKGVNTTINKIKQVYEDKSDDIRESDGTAPHLFELISQLQQTGMTTAEISETLFVGLGISRESVPPAILNLLK